MTEFPPEKSVLHIVSKAQIRLKQYWSTLWQTLNLNSTFNYKAGQSGITIYPYVFDDSPFHWRLKNEVTIHFIKGKDYPNKDCTNYPSLVIGFEILWNEDLWAMSCYAEELIYTNKHGINSNKKSLHTFKQYEAKTLDELRTIIDLALDELFSTQQICDYLFKGNVSNQEIKDNIQKVDWNSEPRKSLFS